LELYGDSFDPNILISKGLLSSLLEKLQIIKKTLLNNRSISAQILFEEISPALGKYYRKLRLEFTDPEEALEALWGERKNGVDYSSISSLLNSEELRTLPMENSFLLESTRPEDLIQEFKNQIVSGQIPLDLFIQRHSLRKRKSVLNLRVVLEELQLLVQEGLTNSQSIKDIVDFHYSLSKMVDHDHHILKEIISLLSNLPHPELKWLLTLEKYFSREDCFVPKDLIPPSVPVFGAFMKKRTFLLTESESQSLFDHQGSIRENASLTGRSSATFFPDKHPEFTLKQYPKWPGYEFASILFMRLLGVTRLPYQDFLVINNYPVLLTQKVDGDPIHQIWDNPKAFYNLDPFHTGLLIISAMLLNPEEGKEDNFVLSKDEKYLIPNNYHWFLPSFFQKEISFWNPMTVNAGFQTKTLLFCLDEMLKPIPLEVKYHILSIDFDTLFTSWMKQVVKIEDKLFNLTDQNQRNKFLKHGTAMNIPFYKQFIHNIHWKAHKIQDILKTAHELTPFDLLKVVEPFVAKCYKDSFRRNHNPLGRFISTTLELHKQRGIDGSRIMILDSRAMIEITNIPEEDLQNDPFHQRIGPVNALGLLGQLIQERGSRDRAEQKLLCELDGRKALGLEAALKNFFINSQIGLALIGSRLMTGSKLRDLFALAPNKGKEIRFLSLPESPFFTGEAISILAKECPNLEYLNVSGCEKLKEIVSARGEWSLLVRLEAQECLNLERFVSYSPLRALRIETDQNLDIFIEKFPVEIFTVSKKINQFDLMLKE